MTVLPTNVSLNMSQTEEAISSYDTKGAMIYIVGVLIWYAIGFGLTLIDDINPQPGRIATHGDVSLYRTGTDLHEEQVRNDILVELKDKDRRAKLWQIYYGTHKSHPVIIQKDKETIEFIIKQLSELNCRRRLLRNTLNEISVDYPDVEHSHDDSDSESYYGSQTINRNK